jgi:hypothetical protein
MWRAQLSSENARYLVIVCAVLGLAVVGLFALMFWLG